MHVRKLTIMYYVPYMIIALCPYVLCSLYDYRMQVNMKLPYTSFY